MTKELERTANLYTQGMCDAMAIAISRRTGLPLALIGSRTLLPSEDDDPDFDFVARHAVVIVDAGEPSWLDVNGLNKGLDFNFFLPFEEEGEIVLQESSEEEIIYAFSMEGVSNDQIKEADAFMDRYEPLMNALANLVAGYHAP